MLSRKVKYACTLGSRSVINNLLFRELFLFIHWPGSEIQYKRLPLFSYSNTSYVGTGTLFGQYAKFCVASLHRKLPEFDFFNMWDVDTNVLSKIFTHLWKLSCCLGNAKMHRMSNTIKYGGIQPNISEPTPHLWAPCRALVWIIWIFVKYFKLVK